MGIGRHGTMAVLTLLAAAALPACGSDPADDAGQRQGTTATTAPIADMALPGGPVEPLIHVEADGVWAIGGTQRDGDRWAANALAVRYGADGTPERSVPLPLEDDEVADLALSATSTDHGMVIAATVCPLIADAENSPCGRPAASELWVLDDEGIRVLDPTPALAAPMPDASLDGHLRIAGTVDDRALVVRVVGDGEISTFTSVVDAWLVDPTSGEAEPLATPDGVVDPTTVCAIDDSVYALVPAIEDGAVSSAAVQRTSVDGDEASVVATLPAEVPVYGGRLHCLPAVLVVEAVGSPATTFTVVDRATGVVVGEPLAVERFGAATLANLAEGSLVVTQARDTGAAWLVDGSGARPAGTFEPSTGPSGARGVVLGGAVVDVRKVATDPSSEAPFPGVVPA